MSSSSSYANCFFSVPARFSGRVVARIHGATRSVWAWRAPRSGELPSPACLFVGFHSTNGAARLATAAARLGWRAWVKAGASCAVFATGPLAATAPPWACKVQLPPHLSATAARLALGAAARRSA